MSSFVLLLDYIDTHDTILLCLEFRTVIHLSIDIQISIRGTLPDSGAEKSFTSMM